MNPLIIIEGTDGSGKTTQLKKMVEYYDSINQEVETLDFPQYSEFWGSMVGDFVSGKFGELDQVNPYLASLPYLLDQQTSIKLVQKAKSDEKIVLSNRYVTSSMAHQTCKFHKLEEQDKYLTWLQEAAYDKLGLVKEDFVIVLYIDPELSIKLARQDLKRKETYSKGRDIAEESIKHITDSANMYRKLCKKFDHWHLIECMKDGQLMSIDEIHELVKNKINSLIF